MGIEYGRFITAEERFRVSKYHCVAASGQRRGSPHGRGRRRRRRQHFSCSRMVGRDPGRRASLRRRCIPSVSGTAALRLPRETGDDGAKRNDRKGCLHGQDPVVRWRVLFRSKRTPSIAGSVSRRVKLRIDRRDVNRSAAHHQAGFSLSRNPLMPLRKSSVVRPIALYATACAMASERSSFSMSRRSCLVRRTAWGEVFSAIS